MKCVLFIVSWVFLFTQAIPSMDTPTNGPTLLNAVTCGNVVGSDGIDISDLVYIVSYMFQGGPAPVPDVCFADINGSGGVPDISDLVHLVNYMFQSGPPPGTGCCPDCFDGETRLCYSGSPSSAGVGECRAGIQTCQDGSWGLA